MLGCGITLANSHDVYGVIAAQVGLAFILVIVGTFLSRLFHDEIPSNIRAGVASGVGTLTWAAFLPFALVFGYVTKHTGVHTAAWMIVAVTLLTSASLLYLTAGRRHETAPADQRGDTEADATQMLMPVLVEA
jgi:MFS family permease